MAASAIVLSPVQMEDPNLLAADCVVICGCCPCLILQVLVLLLVRLPCKLARGSKKLVLRKLRRGPGRRRRKREVVAGEVTVGGGEGPLSVQMGIADAVRGGGGCSRCAIAEAERVLEQLYERGELGFGGFWRRGCGGGGGAGAPLPWNAVLADRLVVRGGGSNVHTVGVHYA